jgi:glycosyltransferase involved in cell wall biosynthesis
MLGGMHISVDEQTMEYYRNAHHIIVHTEVQRQILKQKAEFKDIQIRVMPLGIDTDTFIPSREASETVNLLFVGRISRLKQLELCLESLSYLEKHQEKKVALTIVGPISDADYYEDLLSLTAALNLKDKVSFVGMIGQEQLVPYYQNADLLLLPSSHESFGMVLVEAMSCGIPVAALKGAGGPDELVVDGVNGLLCSKEDYSQRILALVNSTEAQHTMRDNCRRMVLEKWSLAATVSSLRTSIMDVF